jgi:hypothetical protein
LRTLLGWVNEGDKRDRAALINRRVPGRKALGNNLNQRRILGKKRWPKKGNPGDVDPGLTEIECP